jgi:hypothetical protein
MVSHLNINAINFLYSLRTDDGTDESYQISRSYLNGLLISLKSADLISKEESEIALREFCNIKKEFQSATIQKVISLAENFSQQITTS